MGAYFLLAILKAFPKIASNVYTRLDMLAFSNALAGINLRMAMFWEHGRPENV